MCSHGSATSIGWQQGGDAYKVTWGAAGTTMPTAYETTYNAFVTLLSISHPSEPAQVATDRIQPMLYIA